VVGVDDRRAATCSHRLPLPGFLLVRLSGAYPEIVGDPGIRDPTPFDDGDSPEHTVQVFAGQLGEQVAERDPPLAAAQLGCYREQQSLPGPAAVFDQLLKLAEIDRPVARQPGGGERLDARRARRW
jgi:hypothetical protein